MRLRVANFITERSKAIAGVLTPIAVWLLAKKGVHVNKDVATLLVGSVITGFTVWLVPNKKVAK